MEKVGHKVSTEQIGIMIDPDGNLFDCLGRFTTDEIEEKFGSGNKAILSYKKPKNRTERLNTLNLAQT